MPLFRQETRFMSHSPCPGLTQRIAAFAGRLLTGQVGLRQFVRIVMRVTRFEAWGVRPITERRFRRLIADLEWLRENERLLEGHIAGMTCQLGEAAAQTETLRRELEQQVRDLEAQHARERDRIAETHETIACLHGAIDQLTVERNTLQEVATTADSLRTAVAQAGQGASAFVRAFQQILFDEGRETQATRSTVSCIMAGYPAAVTLETMLVLNDSRSGARGFRNLVPMIAASRAFPDAGAIALRIGRFQVIDIGSQDLGWEADIYAPLARSWPTETIGFDPFMPEPPAAGFHNVQRADGTVVRTVPTLVGDGAPGLFHINRQDSTSSLLPGNLDLARGFGLLELSLETVETRELPTRRLDDLLADKMLFSDRVDFLKIDIQGTAATVIAHASAVLKQTLVCHVEVEFAEVYRGQTLFAEVDALLRRSGFGFVDFYSLGRLRHSALDPSNRRFAHAGRTLWADAVYLRGLDDGDGALVPEDLLRAAVIMHEVYNKQDLAAELLARFDQVTGETLLARYLAEDGNPWVIGGAGNGCP
jgi:FkbM family methyltransferase